MKKIFIYLLIISMIAVFFLSGCMAKVAEEAKEEEAVEVFKEEEATTEEEEETVEKVVEETNVKAIAAGLRHTVALKEDGTVVAWGDNSYGQCNIPEGLTNVKAIAAGSSYTVALKEDGTVVAWGWNSYGQCNQPKGSLANVKAIAAGFSHTVALKEDGTIVAWGDDGFRKCNIPEGLVDIKAIAAGTYHTVALKEDGTVVIWWDDAGSQCNIPEGLTNVKAIAAGLSHTVALKEDGTVVIWGNNNRGQCKIPEGLVDVKAVTVGGMCTFVLKEDGTVVAWGDNSYGQCNIPKSLANVKAIAAGSSHVVALKEDGTVVAWGWNGYGQINNICTNEVISAKVINIASCTSTPTPISTTTTIPSSTLLSTANTSIPQLTVRVMSYNILFGAGVNRESNMNRLSDLITLVKQVNPDIMGLEEVCEWESGNPTIISQFASELDMNYYYAPTWRGIDLAIFSKFTILETENLSEYVGNNGALRVVLQTPDGQKLNVVVVHLDPEDVVLRSSQFDKLRRTMESYSNQPSILMGDTNALPNSQEVKYLTQGGWELVQSETIDNIFMLSKQAWSKAPISIMDTGISDHKPVGATISFYK